MMMTSSLNNFSNRNKSLLWRGTANRRATFDDDGNGDDIICCASLVPDLMLYGDGGDDEWLIISRRSASRLGVSSIPVCW